MKFLRRLFGKKDIAAAPSSSSEEVMGKMASEYRRRMVDEIRDIETRSRSHGKLAEMTALRDQILATLTGSVVTLLAQEFNLSTLDISDYLSRHAIFPEEGDPFAEFRGPNHLMEGTDETLFTFYLQLLSRLTVGAKVARSILDDLKKASKKLWDSNAQRAGAQAIYWWIDRLEGESGLPVTLAEKDVALLAAVGFVEQSRTARSGEEAIILMQQALAEAIRAEPVGGAEVLHVRLAHTLGPLGRLPRVGRSQPAPQREVRRSHRPPAPPMRLGTGDGLRTFLARDLPRYPGLSTECVTLLASSLIDCPIWHYKLRRFPPGAQFGHFYLLTDSESPRKLWPTMKAVRETALAGTLSPDLPNDIWASSGFLDFRSSEEPNIAPRYVVALCQLRLGGYVEWNDGHGHFTLTSEKGEEVALAVVPEAVLWRGSLG